MAGTGKFADTSCLEWLPLMSGSVATATEGDHLVSWVRNFAHAKRLEGQLDAPIGEC